jgi:hypothetical protein
MTQPSMTQIPGRLPGDAQWRASRLRRFKAAVSLALILLCNAILLVGIWASGVNLDELVKTPEFFNSKQDICLRLAWQRVAGAAEPMRICSEWINLSDPSGKTHHIQKDMKVRQGTDGHFYVDGGVQADYRLLGIALFVAIVIALGVVIKRYLVSRYRLHLEGVAGHPSR